VINNIILTATTPQQELLRIMANERCQILPLSTIIQAQNCSIALPLDTPITISRDLADSTLANGSLLGELEELNKEVDRTRERYPKAWSRKMTMLIQINNIWKLISSRGTNTAIPFSL
jgi:hypothetical protein